MSPAEHVGVVVIGRNEGERLRVCLDSLIDLARRVVYVDSGSTDNSISIAQSRGAVVVALDMSIGFTAGRARNAGVKKLRELDPNVAFVQFIDGDCELDRNWLTCAARFLDQHPDVAAVSGRLRERNPQASIYNMLCDMEWEAPAGEARECGGNALVRASAFEQISGFREGLIAGEEPELCLRLRRDGWRVWHLDQPMALHDAAMTSFSQWWRRMTRGGYSYAIARYLHGSSRDRHRVREYYSAWAWGAVVPALVIIYVALFGPWGLLILGIYPIQIVRLALRGHRSRRENWWRALFLVTGKFPEVLGQTRFLRDHYLGRRSQLIEYK